MVVGTVLKHNRPAYHTMFTDQCNKPICPMPPDCPVGIHHRVTQVSHVTMFRIGSTVVSVERVEMTSQVPTATLQRQHSGFIGPLVYVESVSA